jgi:hypothetical protein
MKKRSMFVIAGVLLMSASVQAAPWGNVLKSAGQAAGQAAVQAAVQQMTPQAQTVVTEANKLAAGAPQENFLVAKAKEFLAAGNYQPAWDLANYVITTLKSGSLDAKKVLVDAQTALTKLAQEKAAQATQAATGTVQKGQAEAAAAQQVQKDASQTATGIKNLFGK